MSSSSLEVAMIQIIATKASGESRRIDWELYAPDAAVAEAADLAFSMGYEVTEVTVRMPDGSERLIALWYYTDRVV